MELGFNSGIKRGVSLYSFQEEVFHGKMNLEDCIYQTAKTGAKGIEIVGEQSIPGCPKIPSEKFQKQWFEWMEKYGVEPTCHDMFLDFTKIKGHYYTERESIESFKKEIDFAKALGFKFIRVIVNVPPEIIEQVIPYAEDNNIKLGIEVHSPWHINSAWMARHYEIMLKMNTKHFGFIPDLGAFTKRLPKIQLENMVRKGANQKIADYVAEEHEKGVMAEYIIAKVAQMTNNRIDLATAELSRHNIYVNPFSLLPYMDNIIHVHAKFYEMQEDYTEYSIPYDQIVEVFKKGNYMGYLSSEYEGNRHIHDIYEVDSVEQVRRHQKMLENLIG
jgi:sugar phosphate isomerase/epimerase